MYYADGKWHVLICRRKLSLILLSLLCFTVSFIERKKKGNWWINCAEMKWRWNNDTACNDFMLKTMKIVWRISTITAKIMSTSCRSRNFTIIIMTMRMLRMMWCCDSFGTNFGLKFIAIFWSVPLSCCLSLFSRFIVPFSRLLLQCSGSMKALRKSYDSATREVQVQVWCLNREAYRLWYLPFRQ